MRALATRSTFRPPPLVSVERDSGYYNPTHPFLSSYQTPAPHSHVSHYTPSPTHGKTSYDTPSPFLSSLADDISTVLEVTSFREGRDKVLSSEHSGVAGAWPSGTNFSDVNLTTSLPTSAVTSSLGNSFINYTLYPAGYPSGYTWPHIIMASIIVTVIIIIIVFGNFLVMWAIVKDKNLKGTQNYFIGSLALADFLLGLLIVPLSLANELMGYWYFGPVLCEVWKAVDVLLCTASISSLCLISLDRYWSITKAIHYSRQRTPKRAAIMIFIVWFVSAAICIPPLIGWNQPAPENTEWPICALSEDIGYVLYSSMGSFYIPAFIMVFVYFKIYQAAKARARKNVSKAPRSAMSEKSEQKNSTESSGTDHQYHSHHNQHQQLQEPVQQQQQKPNRHGCYHPFNNKQPEVKEEHRDNKLKVHPLQSSSVDEAEMEEIELTPAVTPAEEANTDCVQDDIGGREGVEEEGHTSHCKCANEILSDSLTATGATSEEEDVGACGATRQLLDVRTRSLSLPCRSSSASRSDELTKLIGTTTTDSDSCDAIGPGGATGPASLNLIDFGRFGFSYSMPVTTTTDTDSSLELLMPPPLLSRRQQQHQQQQQSQTNSLKEASPHAGSVVSTSSRKSYKGQVTGLVLLAAPDVSPAGGEDGGIVDSGLSTPVREESSVLSVGLCGSGEFIDDDGCSFVGSRDNGKAIQQFRIMEPKLNGSVDVSGSGYNTPVHEHHPHLRDAASTDSQAPSGLFGSLRRQLFPGHHQHNNGKAAQKPHKKKGHNKKAKDSRDSDNKAPDFMSADRHKRKLAKARERRATLVLGLVMAAFILCWLPFFLLYVASAFCMGCIPLMVFTVFFWIGYCNSALNPIIYTVFNRDFRRAFARILCGRRRYRR